MLATYPQPLPEIFITPFAESSMGHILNFHCRSTRSPILCVLYLIADASFFGCLPAQRSPLPVSLSSLMVYAGPWLPMRTLFGFLCLALTVYALSHYMHNEHIDLCIAIYHSAIIEKSPCKAIEIAEFHSSRSPHLERS